MRYIDADKLRDEIEKLKEEIPNYYHPYSCASVLEAYDAILRLIDSLQQEQDLIVINKKTWEAQEQFRIQKKKDFGKPSKEQMKGLLVAIGDEKERGSDVVKPLRSLYEQLKKQM